MESFVRELRYATRILTRSPGFFATAVLTLALGIGSSTAMFSVVDAVLLRALPYPNPQEIVRVWEQAADGHRMNFADPNFGDFRTQSRTFASLAQYDSRLLSVSGGSEPVRVNIADVSSGFFKALGVEPARGRAFAPEEQRPRGAPAAIVSHGYWQRYLGGAADLSGIHLAMGGAVYPVVGVMPPGFDFPAGVVAWVPRELDPPLPSRTAHNWQVLGRLRAGASLAQARADLSAIGRRIRDQFGKDVDLTGAVVTPLSDALVGDVRTGLLTLLGAVGLLLLVACANVAGLLLARASTRRKELAVRLALGAGRGRLIQQFLAESFWLSLAGGALGVVVAAWAVRVLPAILPASLPRQQSISVSLPVLLFAVAATGAVAVSLGLLAAWRASSGDVQEALTAGSRGYTGASQGLRRTLVIGEIAVTLLILVGAGLLGRSFLRLVATSPGFRSENLITMEFSPPIPQWQPGMQQPFDARQTRLFDEIQARLARIPGVNSVGLTGAFPVARGDDLADGQFLILNGQKPPANFEEWGRIAKNPAQVGYASYCVAGEGHFRTLGIPLVRGRMFEEGDSADSTHVAIISRALARKRWPGRDPVGEVIDFGNMDGNLKPLTIVGIAGDVRAAGLDRPPSSVIYVHYRQRGMHANSDPTFLVRTAASEGAIVPAARAIFGELAPDAPVKFSTYEAELGGWLAGRRFLLLLTGLFAGAALGLAAVGIYGVVAFSVARRTQEIGVRMALGAQRSHVTRLIVGEGARLAVVGVAIGVAASFAVTRLLSSLLFGVRATDPGTFFAVAAVLTLVALAASWIPTRRALRLDPNAALRTE